MRGRKALALALIGMGVVLGGQPLRAAEPPPGARFTEAYGYAGCVELRNADTKVVLDPNCGGRVLEYSWKGRNTIHVDPEQAGWVYEPGGKVINPRGGRLDIGPEMVIPKHPILWVGRWKAETTGPRAARLTSQADDATGVQLVRDFVLDELSSHLKCTQTIRNVSGETKHWCHWSRTLAVGGGICLVPLSAESRFPNHYIMYGPEAAMQYRPKDPNIVKRDGFLEIKGTPAFPKLGLDSTVGWFAYLMKEDLLFVKRFPTYPERVYNEMAALTISIYYYKDVMCELEPIGPREDIAPGGSVSFTEDWWILPYGFPADGADIDLEKIRRFVGDKAR